MAMARFSLTVRCPMGSSDERSNCHRPRHEGGDRDSAKTQRSYVLRSDFMSTVIAIGETVIDSSNDSRTVGDSI